MDVNEYINYSEENETEEILTDKEIVDLVTCSEDVMIESEDEEDNSVGLRVVTYKETLNAIELVELYLAQRNVSDAAASEHDKVYHRYMRLWKTPVKHL